ncbi:MAG: hypothetical protein PHD32_06280 [Eubacteriales bacterium]|nr:hypothetical protein [Eubacteriales bacterium]
MKKPLLRLIGLLIVFGLAGSLVSLVLMTPIAALLARGGNALLQWIANVIFISICLTLLYKTAAEEGKKNYIRQQAQNKNDGPEKFPQSPVYTPGRGYWAGAIAQIIPVGLLIWAAVVMPVSPDGSLAETVLRGYFIMYSQLFITWEPALPWLALVPLAVNVLACGLGYTAGAREQKQIASMINRVEAPTK